MHKPVKRGDRFGSLVAVEIVGLTKDNHRKWKCVCDCGKEIDRSSNSLKAGGNSASCGCRSGEAHKTHGMHGTPTYSSWQSAKFRCENKRSKDYPRYGGAGISMCKKWSDSFDEFLKDMGVRPEGTTIDRIDCSSGYEPGNCRWATIDIQAGNKKRVVKTIHNGKEITAKELASEFGISHAAACNRIKRGRIYV